MTEAQRVTLQRLGVDPWKLDWKLADEQVRLPDGRWLWCNGEVHDWPCSPPWDDGAR